MSNIYTFYYIKAAHNSTTNTTSRLANKEIAQVDRETNKKV